jgi:hypothetical protein
LEPAPARASGAKRIARTAALLAASLLVCCGAAEIAARARGYRPFDPGDVSIRVEPGGLYQTFDPRLGYRHLPGRFDVTFDNGDRWTATFAADALRVTRPPASVPEDDGPQIWVLGCSFVEGWGLDDADTFPWKLQQRLPGWNVRNFGVGGYGTLQSLLQFREAIGRGERPRVAVLAYGSFHDERNTRLRRWRKATLPYGRLGPLAQPYARLRSDGGLAIAFDEGSAWTHWPSRHSALAQWVDEAWSRAEDERYRSHAVSERLVAELAREAAAHDVGFVLAAIMGDPETLAMLEHGERIGVPAVDLSVDLGRPGYAIRYDGHPSARATAAYAQKLEAFLRGSGLLARASGPGR